MTESKEGKDLTELILEKPRVGVFICHCGRNIGGYADVPSVVEYARTLPNVVYAEDNLYTCSTDTQQKITETIDEHDLNRVVVASCSPRTHEPLFRDTCRQAGLNEYLFEMANIRDQCTWVHMPGSSKEAKLRLMLSRVTGVNGVEVASVGTAVHVGEGSGLGVDSGDRLGDVLGVAEGAEVPEATRVAQEVGVLVAAGGAQAPNSSEMSTPAADKT